MQNRNKSQNSTIQQQQIQQIRELAKPIEIENCILKTDYFLEVALTFVKENGKGLMLLNKNIKSQHLAEIYLHEINEFLIMKTIIKMEPKTFKTKAIETISHFANCISLNQYVSKDLEDNPIENYIDSEKLPDFESLDSESQKQKRLEDFEDFKPIVSQLIQDIRNYHMQIEKQKNLKKVSFQAKLNIFGSERLEVKASSPESRNKLEKGVIE